VPPVCGLYAAALIDGMDKEAKLIESYKSGEIF